MLHKFLLYPRPDRGCPLCVGSKKQCPIPFPLPLFSPMGRLLSCWPAHGEKRGRGKGMGHWMFLFAQNSLFRIATPPMFSVLVIYWVPDSCVYQIDKKMTECCTIFCCLPDLTGAAHCVWAAKTMPHPLPPSPFLT